MRLPTRAVQQNLQAQIEKYKKDVEPLNVFPMLSAGVAYNFNLGFAITKNETTTPRSAVSSVVEQRCCVAPFHPKVL